MKNTILLETLKEINLLKDREKMQLQIQKIIETLKQEIVLEENKGLSSKQRLNYCLNFARKLQKGKRPVLGYTCNDQIKDKQVFCDSFFLVSLAETDQLPIADYKEAENKLNYPIVERIVVPSNYGVKSFNCNVGKLLQQLKANKEIHLFNEETGFNVLLGEENVKNFLTFMNYSSKDTITLYARTLENTTENTSLSPVYAINKNGSYGIVLPIREYGDRNIIKLEESDLN